MKNLSSQLNQYAKRIYDSFIIFTGSHPEKIEMLAQAGSDRKYYRFYYSSKTLIGVCSDNLEENRSFFYFTRVFNSLNLNVPELFYVSDDETVYFIEDLGNVSLFDLVLTDAKRGSFSPVTMSLFKESINELVKMQISSAPYIDFSNCYQISEFNQESILFDLNYFKFYFLKVSGLVFDECKLQIDFNILSHNLAKTGDKFFMFRDFQSRNIMIKNGAPYFIDYQGGRKGAIQYDLASLLYQAKAQLPIEIKEELLNHYIDQVETYIPVNRIEFVNQFNNYVLVRVLQTLGAYGFRGLIEKKVHFIESIPFALENIRSILSQTSEFDKYPELNSVLNKLAVTDRFQPKVFEKFTVTITSFSFKKSYPNDDSGNGGGFVFDCRGVENPGRYDQYKKLTGRDQEVINFFKEKTDIDKFVGNIIKTVKPTIDNYIDRNFNSLSISFGCTGGQHRSVYCAERIAEYIRKNYKIGLRLHHRELNVSEP
ncbi:MAG: phosphotransferase [Bacteroidales bacterium]|nr:phosphotransferase [Bacteroidales bacterium]